MKLVDRFFARTPAEELSWSEHGQRRADPMHGLDQKPLHPRITAHRRQCVERVVGGPQLQRAKTGASKYLEEPVGRVMKIRIVERLPLRHRADENATATKNAAHLAKCDERVVEMLQDGIGENDVERIASKRDRMRVGEQVGMRGGIVDAHVELPAMSGGLGLVSRSASEVQQPATLGHPGHRGREQLRRIARRTRTGVAKRGPLDSAACQVLDRGAAQRELDAPRSRVLRSKIERHRLRNREATRTGPSRTRKRLPTVGTRNELEIPAFGHLQIIAMPYDACVFRLALIASHVIQYQDPFFKLLAADPEIDLTVLFCSRAGAETYRDREMQTTLRWDLEMLQGYRHRFLRNFGTGSGYTRMINPGVVPELLFGRYDAAIFFLGWGSVTSLLGIAACRMRGLPFFLYGDSSFPPPARTAAQRIRAGFLRMVFGMAAGFLVSGVLNARYYEHYGGSPDRFFLLPWAIDNERFESASRIGPSERKEMRERFGAGDDRMLIVFSAKLLPRKDPMTLLRAVARMRHRDRAAVLFLGEGELRDALARYGAQNDLQVHFAGFVNQSDLPKHYAAADVFVLPSTYEPRGAVVNEAMASGLPVIVTDRCGSIGDIVLEGENAFIYSAGDDAALAARLDELVENPALRTRMAARSREIIAGWSYARGVEGVKEALRATC